MTEKPTEQQKQEIGQNIVYGCRHSGQKPKEGERGKKETESQDKKKSAPTIRDHLR